MNQTEWINLYNLAVGIDPEVDLNPGRTIWQEINRRYTYDAVMVSISQNISLPDQNELNGLLLQIERGSISADEAVRAIENIRVTTRAVYGAGIHLPMRRYDEEIRIKLLPEYQFLGKFSSVRADNMEGDDIIYDNTKGVNTLDVHFTTGVNTKTIRTKVMGKEDSDNYRTTFRRGGGGGETLPCGDLIVDSHSTILTTGLPCTGGCPPNQPTVMAGQTLTIPGNDGVIDRVVIITDGIDFTGSTTNQVILNQLGGTSTFQSWLNQGIDIIFVDWPSPMGFIENNSQYLRSIIEDLNASPDFIAIEALIGISMGGIVSRHTLLEMEEDGVAHNVKTWVSGDSPQEGSNVSAGVQAFAREFGLINNDPTLALMNNILDAPAARQLLLHSISLDDYESLTIHTFCWSFLFWGGCSTWIGDATVNAVPDALHTQLWNWFNSRYPEDTWTNVTIADGGTTTLGPIGQTILRFQNSQATIRTRASNGATSANIIVDKDYNSWFVSDRETNLLNDIMDIDVAPGSTFNVGSFNQPPELIFENTWSFATSTSAVGIPGNPQNTNLSTTPFDAVFMTPTNDAHSVASPAKIAWIESQMDQDLFDPCATEYCDELFEVHECRFGRWVNRYVQTKDGQIVNDDIFADHSPNSDNFTASIGLPITGINLTVGPFSNFVSNVNYTMSNGNINFTVTLDENWIENHFSQMPLPGDEIIFCDEKDFVLTMNGTVEFEGCNGTVNEQDVTVQIIYTYDFCIEVADLDNPLIAPEDNEEEEVLFAAKEVSLSSERTVKSKLLVDEAVIIAPNPAYDFFTVNSKSSSEGALFTLFDAYGKMIFQQKITDGENRIDVSGLTPGIYIANIIDSATKQQTVSKLIIN